VNANIRRVPMANDDLKWFTKRGTIRIIPSRYRAGVAVFVAALLFYNLFGVLFTPVNDDGACGSLARPANARIDRFGETEFGFGWPWDSLKALQEPITAPDDVSDPARYETYLSCPRFISGRIFEFVANFVALWICGWYLRRAMREDAEGVTPGEASTSEN
jgi:hypothetical protein